MRQIKREQPVSSKALKASTIDGVFAAGSDNIVAPYLALFALRMGATAGQVGLLSALPALLGNLMQMPYAMLTDRIGRRKLICILGGMFGRGIWILAALIPFSVMGKAGIWGFIALVTVRGLIVTLGAPAWTALMADIIPKRIRGRYFANRNVYCNVSALGFTLLAGLLVRYYGFPFGYQIIFVLGAILGIIALVYFAAIPDPLEQGRKGEKAETLAAPGHNSHGSESRLSVAQLWRSNPDFRTYTWSSFFWNFAVALPAPLFVIHFANNLGGKADMWSLVSASALVAHIIGQRYWGRRADWFGNKSVMRFSGIGAAVLPLGWIFMPAPWVAIVLNFVGGIAWAGYNLAAFNFILELTPDRQRTSYVGLYNTVAGLAASIGPLLGGYAAELVGVKPIFAVSAVLRFTALIVFLRKVKVGRELMRLEHLLPGTHRTSGSLHEVRHKSRAFKQV